MSKRRDVEAHIKSLEEIHSIMDAMKNMAMMETRKLARYHKLQQEVVGSVTIALNDVRYHFAPEALEPDVLSIYLLFGSERGFCGAYNEQLLDVLARQPNSDKSPLITVGSRLTSLAKQSYPHAVCLPGAAVADELETVLESVLIALNQLRQEHGPLRLEVIHFEPDIHQASCHSALPPLEIGSYPGLSPLINLPPQQLLSALLEQYLFALTHAWFFTALMAENQRRMQHLDQAGHHLKLRLDDLKKQRNVLRQEQIIEEIEVILLSAASLDEPVSNR